MSKEKPSDGELWVVRGRQAVVSGPVQGVYMFQLFDGEVLQPVFPLTWEEIKSDPEIYKAREE